MNNEVVKGFKKDFLAIKQKGFVPSSRIHDTGIGKTFEDLIKIHENNNSLADYMGVLEIKSSRHLSESMVTLFTKSPDPKGVNSVIRERYGKIDAEFPKIRILHTTVSAVAFNTFENRLGFKLQVSEPLGMVYIIIKNLSTGENENLKAYFTFDAIREKVAKKCKQVVYISAENKKENGKEFFRFNKALLLSGLSFEKFIEFLKKGLIVYDIRLGIYRSGPKIGKPHDHGTGFRILKRNISEVFVVQEL